MDPIAKGILLGLLNMIVIAFGLSVAISTREIAGPIMLFGFVPAMLIGALDGGIADRTARCAPWIRMLLLSPIPIGFVWMMANALRLGSPGDAACIPTLVAVLILEKTSRTQPLVPRAHVT